MNSKDTKHLNESDNQFTERIRLETKKKILERSKPLDLEALTTSMSLDEPSHLGNLSKRGTRSD